jgi:hypothetical protein
LTKNLIPLVKINTVIISADTFIFKYPNSIEFIRAFSLSFSFTIKYDNQSVEFVIPNKTEFELWILGLKHLCPQAGFIQEKMPKGFIPLQNE